MAGWMPNDEVIDHGVVSVHAEQNPIDHSIGVSSMGVVMI
ncbi:hypothetical protein VFA_002402 [Vibrio furnissii CIP 102972]|nr:hypothetical protein VFA_002402 [Vibrio furnissii CIP 102972]